MRVVKQLILVIGSSTGRPRSILDWWDS